MTFWPGVCYCEYCESRHAEEVGGEIPRIVDWQDPNWVKFQRKREEWLREFASLTTAAAKRFKPEAAVNHQFAGASIGPWQLGTPLDLADYCDYLGMDFYGGAVDQSFICKLLYNLTQARPFEFYTSRCCDLGHHTTNKPEELMEEKPKVEDEEPPPPED